MKVFVTRRIPGEGISKLKEHLEVKLSPYDRQLSQDEVIELAQGCEAVATMLTNRVDDKFFDSLPEVRIVANFAVGYDNIDLEAARKRGIVVTNTPGVLTESTADIAMTLILCLARRVVEADRIVRQGEFKGMHPLYFLGTSIQEKTLGIFGMGRIGRALARRAMSFGMTVIYHNRHAIPDFKEARCVSMEELLSSSDFLSINAPLSDETRGRFGINEFQAMKSSAYLVNTARGPLVKESELAMALQKRLIAGAGLDVYEDEPRVHPALVHMDNVVLLPHIGSATKEVRARMAEMVADNIISFYRGENPPNRVV